jgi:hypothetical protein
MGSFKGFDASNRYATGMAGMGVWPPISFRTSQDSANFSGSRIVPERAPQKIWPPQACLPAASITVFT